MSKPVAQNAGPEAIAAYFTRSDGTYVFSRWGRPMAPVVFGVAEKTLATVKGALEAVAALTGRALADVDPELGTNLMIFFVRDWDELRATPDLDRLIPDLTALIARLEEAEANQYRIFRFDNGGAIRACFAFVKMDRHMATAPAETLALTQAVQVALLWSDTAFSRDMEGAPRSMLARTDQGHTILSPQVADLLRAAYDPVLPDHSRDPTHALRLAARMGGTIH